MNHEDLLSILACPKCRSPLAAQAQRLSCRACGGFYPVRDGIPVLLIEELRFKDSTEQNPEAPGSPT